MTIIGSMWAGAQTKPLENNEFYTSVGTLFPMNNKVDGDMLVGFHYGHYYSTGIGYRAGLQYTPTFAEIDNFIGIPVAFTYRTKSRSARMNIDSIAYGTMHTILRNDKEDFLSSAIEAIFLNLIDRFEFHAGLTPGYTAGKSTNIKHQYERDTWIEKKHGLSLSADAGFNINWRIWNFDLKAMSAVHYNLTNNFSYNKITTIDTVTGETSTNVQPIRVFFSVGAGLAYRF